MERENFGFTPSLKSSTEVNLNISKSSEVFGLVKNQTLLTQTGNLIKQGNIRVDLSESEYENYMIGLLDLLDRETSSGSMKPFSTHIFHFALSDLILAKLQHCNPEYNIPKNILNRQKFYMGLFRKDEHLGLQYFGFKDLIFPERDEENTSNIKNSSKALLDMTPLDMIRFTKFKFNQIINTSIKKNAIEAAKIARTVYNRLRD